MMVLLGATALAHADTSWPDYRGPSANGHAQATGLPLEFSEADAKWKTAIPGKGWSSPVIWGDQVWMTTANEGGTRRYAICVNRETGEIVHHIEVFRPQKVGFLHSLNSHASPSPAIEAGRVYVTFGNYGTACIDTASGAVLWRRTDLNLDHQLGAGSSPILYNDKLIMHMDGIDKQFIVALDKATGRTAWLTQRDPSIQSESPNRRKSYNVPVVIERDGRDELISVAAHFLYGYDPDTGKELWRCGRDGYSNVARPVIGHGLVIYSTCYDKPSLVAVRLGAGRGAIDPDEATAWVYRRSVMNRPSPLLIGDLFYMVSDSGVMSCLEAKTGEEVYRERVGDEYSASMLYADGRIYLFGHEGLVTVIKPARVFEKLAQFEFGSGFMASPAVVDNALYLRTKTHLYRIER